MPPGHVIARSAALADIESAVHAHLRVSGMGLFAADDPLSRLVLEPVLAGVAG